MHHHAINESTLKTLGDAQIYLPRPPAVPWLKGILTLLFLMTYICLSVSEAPKYLEEVNSALRTVYDQPSREEPMCLVIRQHFALLGIEDAEWIYSSNPE